MTKTRETVIPDIPDLRKSGDEGTFYRAVKEALDVALRRRGDGLDGFVRFRDLRDGGIANVNMVGGRVSTGGRPGSDGGGGGGGFLTPTPPGTRPPPTGHVNVRTKSVWDGIMIQWDWPPGLIEYAYTEVWAAKLVGGVVPTFTQATLVGSAQGNLFVHTNLGLGAVWYYWLRYVGFVPPNNPSGQPPMSLFTPSEAGPGVRGETAADPTYVLDVLEGQIAEDQLDIGLSDRIDLVDYYYDGNGNKVPVPAVDILDDDGNPTGQTTQAVHNRVLAAIRDVNSDFQAAIAQEASIRARDDGVIIGTYGVKIDIGGYVSGFGLVARRRPGGTLEDGGPLYESGFIVRADKFAVVRPRQPGEPDTLPETVPFIVGVVNGVSTVGINGQLVVDGTITARHIQANTIGAREINAQSVWTGVLNADRIFASAFATSGDTNYRVVIGGQNATYPFWYGSGGVGGTSIEGATNPVFYFDRNGNASLAGNLSVTGVGRFSTSRGNSDARVEIGGDDGILLWAGSGQRTTANAKFYFDNDGNLVIRGNPVTFPIGQGSGSTNPRMSLSVVPVEGVSTIPILVMARTTVMAGSAFYEKEVRAAILMDGVERAVFSTSNNDYVFSESQFAVIHVQNAAASRAFEMRVTIPRVAGGNQIPTVQYRDSQIFALQLSAST